MGGSDSSSSSSSSLGRAGTFSGQPGPSGAGTGAIVSSNATNGGSSGSAGANQGANAMFNPPLPASLLAEADEVLPVSLTTSNSSPGNTATNSNVGSQSDGAAGGNNNGNNNSIYEFIQSRSWDTSQRQTKEDWIDWMARFSSELLKYSASRSLAACHKLSQSYPLLAGELFNASFVCCWTQLDDKLKSELIRHLTWAIHYPQSPPEILQTVLNLAEFMEHDHQPLPIPIHILGQVAETCAAYAKALHYTEHEFKREPQSATESLISINNKLELSEAASGVLIYVQRIYEIKQKESWYEKLHLWDAALKVYEKKQKSKPDLANDIGLTLGRMRCLNALGEWEELQTLANDYWQVLQSTVHPDDGGGSVEGNINVQKQMALFAANASWHLHNFDLLGKYIGVIPDTNLEGSFYRAILEIHKNNFEQGEKYINSARSALDTELRALVGEGYTRAYKLILRAQHLTHLEQIIELKRFNHLRNASNIQQNLSSSTSSSLSSLSLSTASASLTPTAEYNSERTSVILDSWKQRLKGSRHEVSVWQDLLALNSMVITPHEDLDQWLKFASLCRRGSRFKLAERTLIRLMKPETVSGLISGGGGASLLGENQKVAFAWIEHLWAVGVDKQKIDIQIESYKYLESFTQKILSSAPTPVSNYLLPRCYLKLGSWLKALGSSGKNSRQGTNNNNNNMGYNAVSNTRQYGNNNNVNINEVLEYYKRVTQISPDWAKAWHAWALANYELTQPGDDSNSNNLGSKLKLDPHIIPSIQGFFKSMALSQAAAAADASGWRKKWDDNSTLQDVLRLLNITFNYAHFKVVEDAIYEGLNIVSIETWLQVIPQLIARIHIPVPAISNILTQLLIRLGEKHPQALVYPLAVAIKSPQPARVAAAYKVLESMSTNIVSQTLVDQAQLVSKELIRVAILWEELWHDAIDDAYVYWHKHRDVDKMLEILNPLNEKLLGYPLTLQTANKGASSGGNNNSNNNNNNAANGNTAPSFGPETNSEMDFDNQYGKDIKEAAQFVLKYHKSKKTSHMDEAWAVYSRIFRRLYKKLTDATDVDLALSDVSPRLVRARNLELAVPGTYNAYHDVIRISSFSMPVTLITSKQRPKRLTIFGSNGKAYTFLLKGHEDLRQDERVMQVFGLINSKLTSDRKTLGGGNEIGQGLKIQQYSIIPLSPVSGLIGYLLNHITLHDLICNYRDSQKIAIKAEFNAMRNMAPSYLLLSVIQKVEVFKEGLKSTEGDDLEKIFWLKSPNSEVWLERRTNYTRSLATMSMVGYILGLGDRHLRNIMLDKGTGKITHIDFGDCFEVAIHRDKYPERIPFRLTRMLIKAMEVSGIEGNFRSTCERVMRVMHDNKESVMAVLEAFVHDPLINWRLLTPSEVDGHLSPQSERHREEEKEQKVVVGSVTTKSRRTIEDLQDFSQSCEGEPVVHKRAEAAIRRVRAKLDGTDFSPRGRGLPIVRLTVEQQVESLIEQATSHENLCQLYVGWCPFW
eukprot:TRINITY_DN1115_c0_g1_i1.p1 TRINITY_DN1115_c0_g1~~TRINITY_DN1115_c0_g1_i1.p1  ORF type:complete len:1488 (-),score=370.97 TRINITY_DN1115_c0_g1_i1:54-4517(-)